MGQIDVQDACEAARRNLAVNDNLLPSQAGFVALVATCEQPPEPTWALVDLMALR